MGFDTHGTQFLLAARASGASFAATATIGRQGLHLDVSQLAANLRAFGFATPEAAARRILSADGFAEPFLTALGAANICSLDASAYEHATRVQDMNQPIPDDLREAFTIVIDGGSLEHVFNFPRAIQNCMEMAQVGGRVIFITPFNNLAGHGFYQFSPELFYRLFSPANGYAVERLLICEAYPTARWYQAVDPATVGRRIQINNNFHTLLYVQAKRTAAVPLFTEPPQQSDYAATWRQFDRAAAGSRPAERSGDDAAAHSTARAGLKQRLPWPLARTYFALRGLLVDPLRNRAFFKEVSLASLAAGQL